MAYLAKDNAHGTTRTALAASTGVTTLQLTTGHGDRFPVVNQGGVGSDETYLVLNDGTDREWVKVTRRDTGSDDCTVVRAIDPELRTQNIGLVRGIDTGALVSLAPLASLFADSHSHTTAATAAHAATAISATVVGITGSNVQALLSATKTYVDAADASLSASLSSKAASGANSDITSLTGLTTPLSVTKGGTSATSASAARSSLAAQETLVSGTNIKTVGGASLLGSGDVSIVPDALSTAGGSAPSYSARAWVNFNGTGTVAIRASGNVSSVTDNNTGDYTVNFATALPDGNYAAMGMGLTTNNSSNFSPTIVVMIGAYASGPTLKSTTQCRIGCALGNTTPLHDDADVSVAFFR